MSSTASKNEESMQQLLIHCYFFKKIELMHFFTSFFNDKLLAVILQILVLTDSF